MKVLFYLFSIPPNYGGGFLRVFRMAARFKTHDKFYKIVTNSPKSSYKKSILDIDKNKDIVFLRNKFICSLFLFPIFLLRNRKKFSVFYVASTHWYTTIPVIVSKLLGKKVVIGITLSMSDSPAVQPKGLIKGTYYKFKNSQFKCADYIFVNSQLVAEECKKCGFDDQVVKLINNPVDINAYHPVEEKQKSELKKEKGLSKDVFTILFVGSINKRKGCDLLPAIFNEFFKRYQNPISFIMCGQKGYPESQTIIDQLTDIFAAYHSNFLVDEEVNNTAPYYQMSDLFLFPTTNEGMPNVILEAMASGCMILCNRLKGITDYVLEDTCLINNNSVYEFVNKMIDYASDSKSYESVLKKNQDKVKKEFSIDSVDSIVECLFES